MEPKTKQFRKRNAILACLQNTHLHPSAEMLHEMLMREHPDISMATVYRNLSLFKEQGTIQSLGMVNGTERFDANTMPHVHFICNRCAAVIDLPQIAAPDQLRNTVEEAAGGRVSECQLSFTGICQNCCQNEKTA